MSIGTHAIAPLSKDDVQRIYPLSPLQQGMLFHDLADPLGRPYHRQVSFTLSGDFNPALARATWNALIERHELLRSVFNYEDTSRFLQIVLKRGEAEFTVEDARGLDPAAQRARLDHDRQSDRARGFDLRRDSLTRIRVFHLAERRFEMVWSHPHILLDGWSGSLLLAEFAEIYGARRRGQTPALAPPPSYGDYLKSVAERPAEPTRRHWAERLQDYDTLAGLPRQPPGRAGGGAPTDVPTVAERTFSLNADSHQALTALATRAGVTLNTVMQGLWGLLLGRHTDSDDVVFGTVVSGRSVALDGLERLVGMLINTIPVRVRAEPGDSFITVLQRLQRAATADSDHDHVALAETQAASALKKGLLDHLLVFENYPLGEALTGSTAETLGFEVTATRADEQANYDFGLLIQPGPPLTLQFKYNPAVHSALQMRRLEERLLALLDQVIAEEWAPLDRLDGLPAPERARLERFAIGPERPVPAGATLVSLWQAQVAATPERVAIATDDQRISYRALNEQANRLARRLREDHGLRPEEPVAMLSGRGPSRVVALLGILKAGGVYLPLSPAFPDDRLRYILDDTACRLAVADVAGWTRLEAIQPGLALLPTPTNPVSDTNTAWLPDPPPSATPDSLAYIIYTSGSTGRPKGVLVRHGGFVNMILEQIHGFEITAEDRVLQFASCSFDASLSELFMALLAGAAVVIVDNAVIRDGLALLERMTQQGVTVITLPPSYLGALMRAEFPGLRVLITAGEPPDEGDVRHYAARLAAFNAYGPTEISVCASFHRVRADAPYPLGIPIGGPLANTRLRILDHRDRLAPIGVAGEIRVAGAGLARGYHNSPELTQQKFVDSPIPGDGRLYRTGDTGLVQEDGEIVYLGRLDGQVKLHGYRIEPGEIEGVLREAPGVRQAAVIVASDPGGGKRLVAYIVTPEPYDPSALRAHLARRLPDYMMPAALVRLPELPRTLAGKIDRRALPSPEAARQAGDDPPVGAIEKAVATSFAETLGRATIGRQDSFLALGGDSLSAIKVVSRLRRQGHALDLRDLLRLDTVAAVAEAVAEAASHDRPEAQPVTGILPLTPSQCRYFAQDATGAGHISHAILLSATVALEEAALREAALAVWRHHDAVRLRFHRSANGITQSIAPPETPDGFAIIDLRTSAEPWPALSARVDALHRSFDLAAGPLFKVVWCRLPDGDHVLVVAHHLVVDALSWRFLIEDLTSAYHQARERRPPRLPTKTSSYRDWALALVRHAQADTILAEKPYWRAVETAPSPPLATDGPAEPHGYEDTAIERISVPLGDAKLSDVQIHAALLLALARALAAWDGRTLTQIMLTGLGRRSPESGLDVSRTVGWFAVNFPFLLTPPPAHEATATALASMRRTLDEAMARGQGYGLLQDLTPPALTTDLAFAPAPKLEVNYLGHMEAESKPGSTFTVSDRIADASAATLQRAPLLELDAMVSQGRLIAALRHAPRVHTPATAARLCALLRTELISLFASDLLASNLGVRR